MSNAIMCGVDMHDNSLVCRIAAGTEEPETRGYRNTERGRQQLLGYMIGIAKMKGSDRMVVAYEASTHGFGLYDDCRDRGVDCFILAPTKMRKSRKDRKHKTDEADAQLILETLRGHILAGNELPSIWIPDDQTRTDRETVRARLDLSHKLTGVKTQVQTLLKSRRMSKPKEAGKSWTRPYRRWLKSLCEEDESWGALATLLRQVTFLEKEIIILDKAILALSKDDRYAMAVHDLIEQIIGVGLLTAMVYLTEMGDLSRFKNRRKVGSFLGLVPSSNETGESADRKGHITREGSGRVRRVLCQASWSRVRSDKEESQVYGRIVSRNPKHKKIAVVATMRRLGVLMWHVGLDAQQRSHAFEAAVAREDMAA